MSRAEKLILWGTAAVMALIMVLDALTPKEPDWQASYLSNKTDPYACGLVYHRLTDLFPQGVDLVREPPYNTAWARLDTGGAAPPVNHLFIDRSFSADSLDVCNLLRMVAAGDDALIAANSMYGFLADTLDVQVNGYWEPFVVSEAADVAKNKEQALPALLFDHADTLQTQFTVAPGKRSGIFKRGELRYYFHHVPGGDAEVLAINQREQPVLVRIAHGKGHLYLCTVPLIFTNYYLLQDEARPFTEAVFSLLPDRPVLWDEYYKLGREGPRTPLRYILGQPALKAAYWTAIWVLFLTILVYARRRQRAIPVVEPPRNTSRDFAETIARLYYVGGDHGDLARKLSFQFKEEVRRRLRLADHQWTDATVRDVALQTGLSEQEVDHARRLMDHYEHIQYVSEDQLLQLNKSLERLRSRL